MNSDTHIRRDSVRFLLALMVLIVGATLGNAQNQDTANKFHLAESYERSQDFESAARLYEQVFARDPSNYVYFDAVRRMYLQLKRYPDAIALIKQRLATTPADLALLTSLASTYYKAGNDKDAMAEWNQAIATNPNNPTVYRVVGQSMLENRLLEKAADMYRRARVECKDPNLFTLDLTQLLTASMDYAGASVELLSWLRQNPTQLAFVQGRFAAITNKEEGRLAAIATVSGELKGTDDPKLLELLGWLYLEGKDYSSALEVYHKLDDITKAHGGQLYAFAERAFNAQAYDIAAKGYQEAINAPLSAARLPYAKYGYANALKEMSDRGDTLQSIAPEGDVPVTEAQPQYAGAIAYFREIIKEYPRTEFSAKSYYQIGTIQFERFFDLDGALASFDHVEKDFPGQNIVHYDVALKIGEVLTAKGDTALAATKYVFVIDAPNTTPDQHDEASYRLARLEYYQGKFQDAVKRLGDLALNLKADYANDALQLLSFLQENNATGENALADFAKADFLATQRRNTEAIPLFLHVIEKYPQALLVDDALMKVAGLEEQARLFDDAIKSYERLLTQFNESSIALDKARFRIGEIYQFNLNDKPKAIREYEKLLADFPQSILATSARKRIRTLRGDSL